MKMFLDENVCGRVFFSGKLDENVPNRVERHHTAHVAAESIKILT